MHLYHCERNTFKGNNIRESRYNFVIWGSDLDDFIHDIDASNIVDGKPIYYWVTQHNRQIPADAGFVGVVNSTNITVKDLNLTNNDPNVLFAYTRNSIIENVNASNSRLHSGVQLYSSSNNVLINNVLLNNRYGIYLTGGIDNTIYHNNFINNTIQASVTWSINTWDDGYPSGGNYWSDYTGADLYSGPYQDETGSDGIGDTPYAIDTRSMDRFPLMAPINIFDVGTWNGEVCEIHVVSNSTVSSFQLNATEKIISFNVTGEADSGFCRVTIPNIIIQDMWQGNYTVLVNGDPWHFTNWTDTENTYIYFTYLHSEHEVIIIPELSSALILPFLMIFTLVAAALSNKKRH